MRRVLMFVLGILLFAVPAQAENINLLGYESGTTVGAKFRGKSIKAYTVEFGSRLSDGSSAIGYCVDLPQHAHIGIADYDVLSADQFSNGQQEAAWLMHSYAPGLDNSLLANYSRKDTIAALQMAIWEVIYDENHSLDNGSFRMTWGGNHIFGLASYFLNSIPQNIVSSSIDYSIIGQHSKYQDVLLGKHATIPGGGTPEPASIMLFASSLGVLAWNRRRKKKTMGA